MKKWKISLKDSIGNGMIFLLLFMAVSFFYVAEFEGNTWPFLGLVFPFYVLYGVRAYTYHRLVQFTTYGLLLFGGHQIAPLWASGDILWVALWAMVIYDVVIRKFREVVLTTLWLWCGGGFSLFLLYMSHFYGMDIGRMLPVLLVSVILMGMFVVWHMGMHNRGQSLVAGMGVQGLESINRQLMGWFSLGLMGVVTLLFVLPVHRWLGWLVSWVYQGLVQGLLWVVRLILWPFAQIFPDLQQWNLIIEPELDSPQGDAIFFVEEPEFYPMEDFMWINVIFWALGGLAVLVGVWLFFKQTQRTTQLEEETEDVIQYKFKLRDLKMFLPKPKERVKDPVRRQYIKTVKKHMKQGIFVGQGDTPKMIEAKIKPKEDVRELTQSYEVVRYGKET